MRSSEKPRGASLPSRSRQSCEAYAHCRYAREFRLEPPRRIKAGSVIVREYAGVRHEVFVVENGFSWQGKPIQAPQPSPRRSQARAGMAGASSA